MNNIRRFKNISGAQLGIQQLFPHRIADVVKFNSARFIAPDQIVDLSLVTSRANSEMSDKLLGAVNNGFIVPVESAADAKDAYYPGSTIAQFQANIQKDLAVNGALPVGPVTLVKGIAAAPTAAAGVNLVPLQIQLQNAGTDLFAYDDNLGAKLTLSGTAVTKSIVSVNGLAFVAGKIYYAVNGVLNVVISATNPVALETVVVTPDAGWDAQLVPVTAGLTPTAATATFA